jgi:hypothetical protein
LVERDYGRVFGALERITRQIARRAIVIITKTAVITIGLGGISLRQLTGKLAIFGGPQPPIFGHELGFSGQESDPRSGGLERAPGGRYLLVEHEENQ